MGHSVEWKQRLTCDANASARSLFSFKLVVVWCKWLYNDPKGVIISRRVLYTMLYPSPTKKVYCQRHIAITLDFIDLFKQSMNWRLKAQVQYIGNNKTCFSLDVFTAGL